MKKGISSIISTVLIISIVIVVSGVIFLVAQSFISNAKKGAEIIKVCSEIDFTSVDFCYESVGIQNIITGGTDQKDRIVFGVENKESTYINGFIISLTNTTGNTALVSTLADSGINGKEIKKITSDFIGDSQNIDQIKIFPKISLNNKSFVCEKTDKVLKWSELSLC